MKPIKDKKGRYRKFMDSVDEEIKTMKKIRILFMKLQFKDSHLWVIRWLKDLYGFTK